MFCKNCGKEIVDTSIFCAFCGTKQVIEEIGEPVEVKENENMKTEVPIEETSVKTVDQKNVTEEIGKFLKACTAFIANAFSKINWSEFKVFGKILINPYGDAQLAFLPAFVLLVGMVIVNSIAFYGIVNGLAITAFIYLGAAVLLFLGSGEFMGLKKLISEVSKVVFAPVLAILIGTVVLRVTSHDIYSLADLRARLPELKSAAAFAEALYGFAVVMYTVSLAKGCKKINAYLLVFMITTIIGLCAAYFFMVGMK